MAHRRSVTAIIESEPRKSKNVALKDRSSPERQMFAELKAKKMAIASSFITESEGASPKKSMMKRASAIYDKQGGPDAGEHQIENDRLKTTLMILTQKLKLKEDDTNEGVEKAQA